jgi:hypothetical protein
VSHTPGPWKWFNYPDGRKLLTAKDGAVIHCPDAPMGITPEDQLLIERAPDLLRALKLIESVYRQNVVVEGEPSSVLSDVQAVIAEVETEAPLRLVGR